MILLGYLRFRNLSLLNIPRGTTHLPVHVSTLPSAYPVSIYLAYHPSNKHLLNICPLTHLTISIHYYIHTPINSGIYPTNVHLF